MTYRVPKASPYTGKEWLSRSTFFPVEAMVARPFFSPGAHQAVLAAGVCGRVPGECLPRASNPLPGEVAPDPAFMSS